MQNYIQGVVSALILAGIFWGILTVSMIRDRSRYRREVLRFGENARPLEDAMDVPDE